MSGPDADRFSGQRVAFLGKLGGVSRRDARKLVQEQGGQVAQLSDQVDLIVLGADQLPLDAEQLLAPEVRAAAAAGRLRIISETEFWQRLGDLEDDATGPTLYTPAQLADLLDLSIATIRRWTRRGLLKPRREVHKLPYFDFQEAATARRIAKLLADGASPQAIEQQLEQLARYAPNLERPLAQLAILVEGGHVLLRGDQGLVEPNGQMRIDFDSLGQPTATTSQSPENDEEPATPSTLALPRPSLEMTVEDLCSLAMQYDEADLLAEAAEAYRAALGVGGPQAEICFQLAELLYRLNDVSAARERYFMAVELDANYVEARANLGCVLAETGDLELAVAAFQGALTIHPEYADVHYHLARTLDEAQHYEEANQHWRAFLQLAPASPWADEARQRLELI